jgi:hypothetical protein
VAESQEGKGCIFTTWEEFLNRDVEWTALIPTDRAKGEKAAAVATALVGTSYRRFSSVRRDGGRPRRGLNCVSFAFKLPYRSAFGRTFRNVKTPDDVAKTRGIFES